MGLEITQFRANIGSWLLGISGMAAEVGQRVYSNWPAGPAAYPMMTFALDREPNSDFASPAWSGTVVVEIHDPSEDERDAIENLIVEWLQDTANDICDTLSTDDVLQCAHFQLARIGRDTIFQDIQQEDAYFVGTRTLEFAFALVGLDS